MTDLYALFDLASDASASDIRKAYRKKSLKVHPDRVSPLSRISTVTD